MAGSSPRMTPRKLAFLEGYLRTGNATTAYIAAYNCEGMLRKTCCEAASRLLKTEICQDYLRRHFRQTRELAGITQEKVVRRAAELAFGDVRQLFDEHGDLKPVHKLKRKHAAILTGIDVEQIVTENGDIVRTKKAKLVNPVAALDQLGKLMGMHVVKTEDVTRGGQFVVDLSD